MKKTFPIIFVIILILSFTGNSLADPTAIIEQAKQYPEEERALVFASLMIREQEPLSVGKGKYKIGHEIPPGFYTFYVPEGIEGKITIVGENKSFTKEYTPQGFAEYSMYLPAGASVQISENCTLESITDAFLFQGNLVPYPLKNMRYLIGVQVPNSAYTISTKDPRIKEAYFILSPICADAGKTENFERIDIAPGEEVEIRFDLAECKFIEFVNCIVTTEYAVG